MSSGFDVEIINDFVIEALEIVEELDNLLILLEEVPDEQTTLDAIFRDFHTIKGGAGFLNVEPLVQICHQSENIFDLLRKKQLEITQELIDCILQSIDLIKTILTSLSAGEEVQPVNADFISKLESFVTTAGDNVTEQVDVTEKTTVQDETGQYQTEDSITDDEFEALLDEVQNDKQAAPVENEKTVNQSEKNQQLNADNQEANVQKIPTQDQARVDKTVRVETKVLDTIMNMVGELVLLRNRLTNLSAKNMNDDISATVSNLDVVTTDLQRAVMKTRMQPIKKVFGRFPRLVREVARSLDKDVVLVTQGEETELDKNLVEALADPLVHLIRNAIDHGIEAEDIRVKSHKKPEGTISLSAQQEGDQILLCIEDDGGGIDAERVKQKALARNLITMEDASRLSVEECYELMFMPGFSTREDVTDISGRGVGLDVVKSAISNLNGSIAVQSQLGSGTAIEIRLPLTLAILPTLIVRLRDEEAAFALPLVNVNEIVDYQEQEIRTIDGNKTLLVRGRPVPVFYLHTWLTRQKCIDENYKGHVILVSIGTTQVGLAVDKLIGREEVVIKPLGLLLDQVRGIAGSTITGNGKIALILDLPELYEKNLAA